MWATRLVVNLTKKVGVADVTTTPAAGFEFVPPIRSLGLATVIDPSDVPILKELNGKSGALLGRDTIVEHEVASYPGLVHRHA